jgi:hypothetical protein
VKIAANPTARSATKMSAMTLPIRSSLSSDSSKYFIEWHPSYYELAIGWIEIGQQFNPAPLA